MGYVIHVYRTRPGGSSTSYGEAVAAELGIDPTRIFKTLIVTVDGDPTVAIVPVAAQLSLKAVARVRGGKRAALAEGADAERLTGYLVGGISPFGQRRTLPVVADDSLLRHDSVFVNGGQRGLQVEVDPNDLVAVTGATLAPVAAR